MGIDDASAKKITNALFDKSVVAETLHKQSRGALGSVSDDKVEHIRLGS
jgi:hypothetical protein